MAYYPNYPKLFREQGRPTVYELTPEGYYSPIANPQEFARKGYDWGNIVEAPSFGQLWTQSAEQMYQPGYKSSTALTQSQYDEMQRQQEANLKGEFNRRGILESGLYGQSLAEEQKAVGLQRTSALDALTQQYQQNLQNAISAQQGGQQQAMASYQARQDALAAAAAAQRLAETQLKFYQQPQRTASTYRRFYKAPAKKTYTAPVAQKQYSTRAELEAIQRRQEQAAAAQKAKSSSIWDVLKRYF